MSYVSQISQNDIIDSKSSETNWHLSSTIMQQYTHVLNNILNELMKIKSCLCILCACVYYFNAPSPLSPETSIDTDTNNKYLRLVMGLFFMLSRHPDFYPFNIPNFTSLADLVEDGFDERASQVKDYLKASYLEAHAFGKTSSGADLGNSAYKLTKHLFNDLLIKKQTGDNSENVSQDISTNPYITQLLNELKKYKNVKENIF